MAGSLRPWRTSGSSDEISDEGASESLTAIDVLGPLLVRLAVLSQYILLPKGIEDLHLASVALATR
jgi:hypothetical protein